MNRLRLTAILTEALAPRFTPAGIDVIDLVLTHQSAQTQSADSKPRQVELTLRAVAFSDTARLLTRTALGSQLELEGFLVNGSGKAAKQVMLQIEKCQVAEAPHTLSLDP